MLALSLDTQTMYFLFNFILIMNKSNKVVLKFIYFFLEKLPKYSTICLSCLRIYSTRKLEH